jgi:pSer/pThr/pTyr-binding forkhead associated (FHA) protein
MVAAVTVRADGDLAVGVPPGRVFVIGRARSSDLRVTGEQVSRRHLLLEPVSGGWDAVDVSAAGTWLDGRRVSRVEIQRECRFRLGSADGPEVVVAPEVMTRVITPLAHRPADGAEASEQSTMLARSGTARAPAPEPATAPGPPVTHPLRPGRMSIGRGGANDIVVRDLLASRRHAELVVGPVGVEIVDLDSANGTFVNGRRVERAVLRLDDVVAIGHHLFRFATDRLEESLDTSDATLRLLTDG